MKKLLALVLALVMSMSLVTISNAAFKDADKIDYKEAVDVMNAVGVFIGDEKGNFNAKENLTREQAAKIIAYLELGSKAADALVGSNIFTDVAATRWSAGFIGYCAQAGVVAGVGDSKFDPAGQLTALQFGKMLLVEIGYDAKAAGMTGTDWAINTSKLIATTGLMNGIDGSVNQVITREKAAQMALNALKTPTVEYDTKGSSISVNGAEINFGASTPKYVTSELASARNISSDQLSNQNGYTVELGEKLYPKLVLVDGDYTEAYDTFLRPADTWYYKNQKIGTYETTDFAVDDVVLYTYSYKLDGTKYEGIQSVTKAAAKITGNLSEVTLGKNATVGSTKYDFSKKIANVADTTMLKYDVDVILDSYGYAIDIQPTNTNTAYAYVLNVKANAGDFNSTAKAELLFTDGTTQVVSLTNEKGGTDVYTKGTNSAGTNKVNVLTVGDIVKYQVNNADKYTLERVAQLNAEAVNALADNARTQASGADKTQTSNGSYSFKANNVDYTANGKTLFLVATKNGTGTVYTVYEGIKNVPSITTKAAVNSAVYVENGVAKIVFIDARTNAFVSSSTVIFLKPNATMTATTNSKLGTYYTYSEAIVNGEKVEDFKVAADSFNDVAAARAGGMFTAVAYDDNKIATVSSPISVATGTGKYYNKTVTIAGSAYTYTDDVNVWYLDTNDVLTKVTVTAVADDANDKVYVKKNAGNEITDIVIIEVENKALSNDASIKSITVKGVGAKLVDGVYTATVDVANTTDKRIVIDAADGATVKIVKKGESSEWAGNNNQAFPANSYEFTITVTSEDGAMVKSYTLKFDAVTYYTLTLKTNAAGQAAMVSVDGAEAVMIDNTGVNTIKVANGSKIAVTEISGGTTVSINVEHGTAWVAGTNTWTLRGISADPTVTLTIA